MNNWVAITILILSTFLCTFIVPWYCIAIIGTILGYYWRIKSVHAFVLGVFIPALIWIGLIIIRSLKHDVNIAEILSDLFGGMNSVIIYLITGLIIGLVAGLTILAGQILFNIKHVNR